MMDLLMLGIIPGTDIQIDFKTWLLASLALSGTILLIILYRQRQRAVATVQAAAYFVAWRVLLFGLRIQLAWRLRKTASML